MHFINQMIKKQYLAFVTLIFLVLFFVSSRPALQCEFRQETVFHQETIFHQVTLCHQETVGSSGSRIYGITPTYARLAQKADLTRLSQTLMLVKNFHWIVIEDNDTKTDLVANLLKESTLNYTHLNVKTDKAKHTMPSGVEQRSLALEWLRGHLSLPDETVASGVEQRNLALDWLRGHLSSPDARPGVVYFMDDDNTYSLKVFEEMRKVKKVGVWPVGIVGGMRVEMPLVKDGQVTGYNAVWKPFRPFPIDMAGFAINATLFLDFPAAKFSRKVQSGFQESEILKYLTTQEELEPLADNCTKVYVWHTRTQEPAILNPKIPEVSSIPDDHIEV